MKTPILHAVFNMKELDEGVDENSYFVYFLRKSLLPVRKCEFIARNFFFFIFNSNTLAIMETFEEALSNMPDYFVMGTMRGSFIQKLLILSESILRPLLDLQMRVPMINEKTGIESAIEIDEMEEKIGLIDFSRPSDYRTKAIEAKNAVIHLGDGDSRLSGTSRLSTVATSMESLKTGNTPYEGKGRYIYHYISTKVGNLGRPKAQGVLSFLA